MKRAIEIREIRKGDLIRWEKGEFAYEWRTNRDREQRGMGDGQHYLLDRPTPPVELPSVPTLGWLTVDDDEFIDRDQSILGIWQARRTCVDGGPVGTWSREYVTAFTPATAVPTEALEQFIADVGNWPECYPNSIAGRFLATIDAAGSGE